MEQENMETMQRAIGIIEGCMYGASERVQHALSLAMEMLCEVLDKEGNK